MLTILLFTIITIVVGCITFFNSANWNRGLNTVMAVLVTLCVLSMLIYPALRVEGLFPNYSEGTREGYLTKLSTSGILFKTNEAQLQVGTGNMAALQEPWAFSIPGSSLNQEASTLLGVKVRVYYKQWLVSPYWLGDSPYHVVRFEVIED